MSYANRGRLIGKVCVAVSAGNFPNQISRKWESRSAVYRCGNWLCNNTRHENGLICFWRQMYCLHMIVLQCKIVSFLYCILIILINELQLWSGRGLFFNVEVWLCLSFARMHTRVCGEEAGSGGDRWFRPTIAVGEQDDSFPHHRCPSSLVSRS